LHAEKIAEIQAMVNGTPMKDQVTFVTITILTPDALRLQHEPQADCARYDSLRRAS
jgi:hypothetical protein